MGYKVMTYETPEQLMHPDSLFKSYQDGVHITATNSLKIGMIESNTELIKWLDGPVISFADLAKESGNRWFRSSTELQQFTLLSKVLREHVAGGRVEHAEIHSAVDKNRGLILSTMRMLRESGVTSDWFDKIFEELSSEEKTFVLLYQRMESEGAFSAFDDWILSFENDVVGQFADLLEIVLSNMTKKGDDAFRGGAGCNIDTEEDASEIVSKRFLQKRVIILHGFYFLLPIQKRLFDRLSDHIEVVHIVNHLDGFERGFEPIERFLSYDDTPKVKALNIPYPVNAHAKRFLNALNGRIEDSTEPFGEIYRFRNLYQFKEYAKKDKHHLVSPKAHVIRGYMSELDEMEKQQLSRYPLGRFLLDVHQLNNGRYDTGSNSYVTSENLAVSRIQRIFQSGFLIIDGIQATRYLKALMRVSRLLEQENDFDGWISMLDEIREMKMEIETRLKKKYRHFGGDLDHRLYSRPHEMISHLNVSFEELDAIKKGILGVRDLYLKLFKDQQTNIKDYVNILDQHITDEILPGLQNEADRKVAEEVRTALIDLQESSLETVDQRDLVSGLEFFLAGKPEEDEYVSEMNGRGGKEQGSLVQAMLNSDGLQYAQNRQVHFCVMDQKSFPYTQAMNLWPLKSERTRILFEKSIELSQLGIRKELEFEIACYLFYLLMCNGVHLKFSFIKELEKEKSLAPSFYLTLMGLEVTPPKPIEIEQNAEKEEEESVLTYPTSIESNVRVFNGVVKKTYNYCAKRVIYSFMFEDRPVFESEFHEGFVFQNLLLLGKGDDGIISDSWRHGVNSLFPHLTKTKKDMLNALHQKYWGDKRVWKEQIYLGGEKYSMPQREITLFGKNPRPMRGYTEKTSELPIKANPGLHCIYCPFEKICVDASR
ncbi:MULTISPECIES: hypothetical protein [unclassified Exiguobacterium]|uniref:hypothetical protein n=1 Tax=unclassified Exiguobacterium TaxID=2644629 RepID=UPI00103AFDCE|nr:MULTISPECIES: hypothetical protein [unclassified Exiguobacterium]TCI49689.1 hypothetical protein EVJ25_13695 [Exiguobacterium sp. SH1S4]TCI67814.1 hypothetical protein EVJ23_13430 [Exiguobacterium sp. SH1S1]